MENLPDIQGAPAEQPSTVLHDQQNTDNPINVKPAEPTPAPEPKKAPSASDAVKMAIDKVAAEPKKPETAKPVEAKPAPAAVEKPPVAQVAPSDEDGDDEAGQEERRTQDRQSEGQNRQSEPPARFLPKAKEHWANVPNSVKSEIARWQAEETERSQTYKEYDALKPYADRARQSGTDLPTAVSRLVAMEDTFRQDPAAGYRALAQNLGQSPQQVISHVLRAYGIQPQQLASYIQQNPNAFNALGQQPQQQRAPQPQADPRVDQLQKQLMDMQTQMVAQTHIEPFARENPRYYELEEDIAFFLNSGKIPTSLSPRERLEAAYDMAERINPSSMSAPVGPDEAPEKNARPAKLAGLSITGAPKSGKPNGKAHVYSTRDAVQAAMRQAGI